MICRKGRVRLGASGLPIQLDERLRERLLAGASPEDKLSKTKLSFQDWDYHEPGGETLREAQRVGLAALGEIAGRHRSAIISSHGQRIASILAGIDGAFGFAQWRAMTRPDLYLVTWEDGRAIKFEHLPSSAS